MICVTGAGGFVGRHLVRRLVSLGRPVRAVVRHPDEAGFPAEVEVVVADVTRPETLGRAVEGAGALVHAAALVANRTEPYRGAYDAVNRVGTENVAAAARRAGVGRWVLLSGLGTSRGRPGSYLATRWGMEEAVRRSQIPYAILQPSVCFGTGAPFVTELARLARALPVVPAIGGGGRRFQPIWVEDLAHCLVLCLDDDGLLGAAHPVGGAEQVTFRAIIQAIGRAIGRRRTTVFVPVAVARAEARLMARVLARPPLTPAAVELFTLDQTTRLDAVEHAFGFVPRGFTAHLAAHGLDG
ncbi:MAG TPA: NAD(P)H-binding protein [Candidatus Micrarchaeia archaeon]|nr:NAD(P)H-binding protein [Candidatus Micrarchaeia archaeon]